MCDLTEPEIAYALYHDLASRGTKIMVPHIHLLIGEQDFVAITAAGYAHEYEIKLSRADFRADLRKKENGYGRIAKFKHDLLSGKATSEPLWKDVVTRLPREFWFVLPKSLGIEPVDVPDHAGLIHCERRREEYVGDAVVSLTFVKPAPALRHAEKLDEWARTKIMRALTERLWRAQMREVAGDGKLYASLKQEVRNA